MQLRVPVIIAFITAITNPEKWYMFSYIYTHTILSFAFIQKAGLQTNLEESVPFFSLSSQYCQSWLKYHVCYPSFSISEQLRMANVLEFCQIRSVPFCFAFLTYNELLMRRFQHILLFTYCNHGKEYKKSYSCCCAIEFHNLFGLHTRNFLPGKFSIAFFIKSHFISKYQKHSAKYIRCSVLTLDVFFQAVEKMFDILKQISSQLSILSKEPKVIHLPAIPDRQRQLQGNAWFMFLCLH